MKTFNYAVLKALPRKKGTKKQGLVVALTIKVKGAKWHLNAAQQDDKAGQYKIVDRDLVGLDVGDVVSWKV